MVLRIVQAYVVLEINQNHPVVTKPDDSHNIHIITHILVMNHESKRVTLSTRSVTSLIYWMYPPIMILFIFSINLKKIIRSHPHKRQHLQSIVPYFLFLVVVYFYFFYKYTDDIWNHHDRPRGFSSSNP